MVGGELGREVNSIISGQKIIFVAVDMCQQSMDSSYLFLRNLVLLPSPVILNYTMCMYTYMCMYMKCR